MKNGNRLDATVPREGVTLVANPRGPGLAWFLLLLVALPCAAGQVYKCKGPKGEVTFTNIKCPENSEAQQYGKYEKAPDSPDQYFDAIEQAEARRTRVEQEQSQAQLAPSSPQPEADGRSMQSDAASRVTEDSRSLAGGEARRERAKAERETSSANYWRGTPFEERSERTARERHREAPSPQSAPKPPVTQFCNGTGGGNMTCFGTDGTVSNGHVDRGGHATMFNSNGTVEQTQVGRNANRTCVRDANGFCN
jgi:hypothetical protein